MQLNSNRLPRNRFYFIRFELFDTALNLVHPRSFYALFRFGIQRLKQAPDKFDAVKLAQC